MQQTNLPEKVFAFERIRLVRRAETTAYLTPKSVFQRQGTARSRVQT